MWNGKTVSVVFPTYNEKDSIRKAVEDFFNTGIVDEMSLSYTALTTDEGRRIFVPNSKMASSTLVNRSVDDPRRLVTVSLPVRVDAPLPEARRLALEAVASAPEGAELDLDVRVGQVTERTAWLDVVAFAPFGADSSRVASDVRERALGALSEAGYLPTG